MALFRSIRPVETSQIIRGDGVMLRPPNPSDFPAWSELRGRSRAFLAPWEPTWPEDDLTRIAFRRRLRRYSIEQREDSAYTFFIFSGVQETLVGGLTLSNVRRGVAMSCSLGYWMGEPYAGKGQMSASLRALFPHIFNRMGLRRIEAASMPNNKPSIRLLEKVGFQREGYARKYLCIAGIWQDHLLFAKLSDDQ